MCNCARQPCGGCIASSVQHDGVELPRRPNYAHTEKRNPQNTHRATTLILYCGTPVTYTVYWRSQCLEEARCIHRTTPYRNMGGWRCQSCGKNGSFGYRGNVFAKLTNVLALLRDRICTAPLTHRRRVVIVSLINGNLSGRCGCGLAVHSSTK